MQPPLLSCWATDRGHMKTSEPRIVHLTETGSTNADAMRLALDGEALPLWVVAERQSAGRGRAGRSWASLSGNLNASLAIVSDAPLARAGELALVAGLALYDAVRATTLLATDAGLRLKWPNDLLIGAAKAGGILVETTTARGEPGFLAVIGFGLNIASCPGDLGRAVTCLADRDAAPIPDDVLKALTASCDTWLSHWDSGLGFREHIARTWIDRGGPLGEAISIHTAQGRVTGSYQGLDDSGYLLLKTPDGQAHTFTYGDVALVAYDSNGGTV